MELGHINDQRAVKSVDPGLQSTAYDTAPWLAILPGAAITLAVTGFNFLGDGLRDALDPRMDLQR